MADRRRALGWTLLLGGTVIVLATAWVAVTGLLARSQLETVRGDVARVRDAVAAGRLADARAALDDLATHARRAHALTTGPAWAALAALPAGGESLRSARGLAESADAIAGGSLPALLRARTDLDPARLRRPDGSVDIARISAAAASLAGADRQLATQVRRVAALPSTTWLSTVDRGRARFLGALRGLAGTARSADVAAGVSSRLLGAQHVQRYLVVFQNEAEARGTGGLPGSFAILAADRGRLHFERFGSDSAFDGATSTVRLGTDFTRLYAAGRPSRTFVNGNLSPNFPYAAAIWTDMWQRLHGQHLDGALALDPTALGYLLGATGAAQLPDGTQVTAGDVVDLTERRLYTRFGGDVAARRAYLVAIARAVAERVVGSPGRAGDLVRAGARAAGEGRLLLWASDPSTERLVAGTPIGGTVARTARAYAGMSIVSDGGDKLDYYLDRRLQWRATGCGPTRAVTVTMTLHNGAPAGLPVAVTARSDVHGYRIRPGDNRLSVSYLATAGATLDSVLVDGHVGFVTAGFERGHPVYVVDLELPRGATRTVQLRLREPGGFGAPVVLRQPLVRPLVLDVQDGCG